MKTITINRQKLQVKEFNGQRVVTLRDIDTVHARPEGTARKRFNDNRKRFIQGIDYFVRNSDEAKKEFGIKTPTKLILITESGYLMLVKSFTDDLAWFVQRELVNAYFKQEMKTTSKKAITASGNIFDVVDVPYNLKIQETMKSLKQKCSALIVNLELSNGNFVSAEAYKNYIYVMTQIGLGIALDVCNLKEIDPNIIQKNYKGEVI